MAQKVNPIPEGYGSVTPYLIVNDGAAAIEFYKNAFGATEIMRIGDPAGKIGHAEIKIGDSIIMLADEFPEMGARSAKSIGGSPVKLMIYVENVDATVQHATTLGATVESPVEDKFYGDRSGTIVDPFGHGWHVSTHIEDVAPEEIEKRAAAMFGGG